MSIARLINRECVLRHKTGGTEIDRDGNDIPVVDEIVAVVEIQQRQRRENDDEIGEATWIAFFLPGETVGSGDEIVVDGTTFQVEGDPWNARNPLTRKASHIEATLRRMAGALD